MNLPGESWGARTDEPAFHARNGTTAMAVPLPACLYSLVGEPAPHEPQTRFIAVTPAQVSAAMIAFGLIKAIPCVCTNTPTTTRTRERTP
jgi:hypothetical protein